MTITKHYCDACDKEMPAGGLVRLDCTISYPQGGFISDKELRGDFCCYGCMSDFAGKPPKTEEAPTAT